MDTIEDRAEPIVAGLMQQEDSILYQELALRDQVIQDYPELKDELDPQFARPKSMGITDDVQAVWKNFIGRVNRDAYDLICTKEVRLAELRVFFQNAPERFAAVLVGVLVAESLVPAALATVVAAILAKMILRNAQGALCDVWATKLSTNTP